MQHTQHSEKQGHCVNKNSRQHGRVDRIGATRARKGREGKDRPVRRDVEKTVQAS